MINFFQNSEIDIGTQEYSSSDQSNSLFKNNNNVVTGYEDFCLANGSLTRYPFKDFDFIGKKVVCYECYQKFASRSSYRVHIGTNICVKPDIIRNPVYVKYKSKHCIKIQTTPAMLGDINVFQTRHRTYANGVRFAKQKQRNYPYKAPRKKTQQKNNNEGEPRKRGRPRKINADSDKV